ncbi:MAG: septation protein A [Gammaproteobacteria bacterium]
MQPLFDLLPILLFFITFKVYGVYVGTAVMMGSSLLQNAIYWLIHRRFEKMQLLVLGLVLVLGTFTLVFHNPLFIKWKPTVIYWLFALVFAGSQWIGKKLLIRHMLESSVKFPINIWRQLNLIFAVLFLLMGVLNLYVAYYFSTNTWVNFKLFGALGFTVALTAFLAFYMVKFGENIPKPAKNQQK